MQSVRNCFLSPAHIAAPEGLITRAYGKIHIQRDGLFGPWRRTRCAFVGFHFKGFLDSHFETILGEVLRPALVIAWVVRKVHINIFYYS